MTAPERDQKLIIQTAASGDPEAFRALVQIHQSNVRGALLQLTGFDHTRSDDLAQEVFLTLFQRLSTFRFESAFSTWLYRITYNVFVDDQRARKYLTEEIKTEPIISDSEKLDISDSLKKAMRELSEEERHAIILTSLEELTHEEAAVVMDLPLGSLKTHVRRGKERLRNILRLKGWEVEYEA